MGSTSCAKKSTDTSMSNTPGANPNASTANVTVTSVDLGKSIGSDKKVAESTDKFTPSDVIYASVATSGASAGSTIKARWTYQDGQVVDESSQPIATAGDAVTEFHVSKPGGWPAGKYKVEISVNGTSSQTKDFEVM